MHATRASQHCWVRAGSHFLCGHHGAHCTPAHHLACSVRPLFLSLSFSVFKPAKTRQPPSTLTDTGGGCNFIPQAQRQTNCFRLSTCQQCALSLSRSTLRGFLSVTGCALRRCEELSGRHVESSHGLLAARIRCLSVSLFPLPLESVRSQQRAHRDRPSGNAPRDRLNRGRCVQRLVLRVGAAPPRCCAHDGTSPGEASLSVGRLVRLRTSARTAATAQARRLHTSESWTHARQPV